MSITKLQILRSTGSGHIPTAAQLDFGQLAILYHTGSTGNPDGRLFYKDSNNIIRVVSGTDGSGGTVGSGTVGQVAYFSGSQQSLVGASILFISTSVSTIAVSGTLEVIPSSTLTLEAYPYRWPVQSGNLSGSSYPPAGTVLTIQSLPTASITKALDHRVFSAGSGCFAPLAFSASVDDDTGTFWTTAGSLQNAGMTYVAKLNATQSVARISWDQNAGPNYPTAGQIQTSINGVDYYPQVAFPDGANQDITLASPVFATHVRLGNITPRVSQYWEIHTFNVYTPLYGIQLAWVTQSATLPGGVVSSSIQINTGSFTGSFIGSHTGALFGTSSWSVSSSWSPSSLPVAVSSGSTQQLIASVTDLNFWGTGVSVSQSNNTASINISAGSGQVAVSSGSGELLISSVTELNFWGTGVSVSQSNNTASIKISSGSGGGGGSSNAFIYALLFG